MKTKRSKRPKAFIGALIGAATSIIGSSMAASAQERAQREAQLRQNKNDTLTMAQNLSAAYGNQDYADEFANRAKFAKGGMKKVKLVSGNNIVSRASKFRCGGRKKFEDGGGIQLFDGANDLNAIVSGLGNLGGSAITASANNGPVKQGTIFKGQAKTDIKSPDYSPAQLQFRYGGRRCKHRK